MVADLKGENGLESFVDRDGHMVPRSAYRGRARRRQTHATRAAVVLAWHVVVAVTKRGEATPDAPGCLRVVRRGARAVHVRRTRPYHMRRRVSRFLQPLRQKVPARGRSFRLQTSLCPRALPLRAARADFRFSLISVSLHIARIVEHLVVDARGCGCVAIES